MPEVDVVVDGNVTVVDDAALVVVGGFDEVVVGIVGAALDGMVVQYCCLTSKSSIAMSPV